MTEHYEKHSLNYWPKRNDPLRATVVPQLMKCKDKMNNNSTLSRCRSLEFLDDRNRKLEQGGKRNSHRSIDLLKSIVQHEAVIHNMTNAELSKSSSLKHSTNTSDSGQNSSKQCSLKKCGEAHSTLSDAGSLENFSNKTKEIIQMKRASRQKFKERTMKVLREKKKNENSILKYPPNFCSTLTSNSLDNLSDFHSPQHYPNDFDDISVEMKNITKLLSASLIEPLESAASTSSSLYQSTNKLLAKRFTLYNNDHNDEDGDDDSSIKSELELEATNSNESKSTYNNTTQAKPFTANGYFFQNTCFENKSSSSCDTLKSIDLSILKSDGKSTTNGNNNAGVGEESDTDLEEVNDVQNYSHRAPRHGIVSARIKSLLAQNAHVLNKMPTVRSTLVSNTSNFKSSTLSRSPLKASDSQKPKTSSNTPQDNASPIAHSTNHEDEEISETIDSPKTEAQIPNTCDHHRFE